MKLNTKKQDATYCLDELAKLRHLLSVLCQAINNNNHERDDIEGSADSTPKCNAKPPILALQTPQTVA